MTHQFLPRHAQRKRTRTDLELQAASGALGAAGVAPYYFSTGTEQFDGCIDANGSDSCSQGEPTGQLFFDFVFWARFDDNGAEIEGDC